jgi:hypothetical protein
MSVDGVDLLAVARAVRAVAEHLPDSRARGEMILRDEIASLRGCAEADAGALLEMMLARGWIAFEPEPRPSLPDRGAWAFRLPDDS